MSRTVHHSGKHGRPRDNRRWDNPRSPGYDYMSRRWGNEGGVNCPARDVKPMTHRAERRIAKHNLSKDDCVSQSRLDREWRAEDALAVDWDEETAWEYWQYYLDHLDSRYAPVVVQSA